MLKRPPWGGALMERPPMTILKGGYACSAYKFFRLRLAPL
jgi:hypothetical protein